MYLAVSRLKRVGEIKLYPASHCFLRVTSLSFVVILLFIRKMRRCNYYGSNARQAALVRELTDCQAII